MGPPEVIVGWVVFLSLGALAAALGVSGRLRLGESLTLGLLAVPAGLGMGGTIDAVRNELSGPLRYSIPSLVIASGGTIALRHAIARARARAERAQRPWPFPAGLGIVAATVVTTTLATLAATAIAGRGAPVWVAPALTGILTFVTGSAMVARARRAERAITGLAPPPAAVSGRSAIAVTLGLVMPLFYLSLSPLAVLPLFALPFTIGLLWTAARDASVLGRTFFAMLVALNILPLGVIAVVPFAEDLMVRIAAGGGVAVAVAAIFWLAAAELRAPRHVG